MRVIAGQWRGLRLAAVGKGDSRNHLRPTTDRVRESLFNILNTHIDMAGQQVLDLFAGSGALGLESLSRGAAHCTFVENGRAGLGLIAQNIRLTRSMDQTTIIKRDATKLGPKPNAGPPKGLVFLDPPYGKDLGQKALANALAQGWLAADALVVWEESTPMSHPGLTVRDTRKFGNSHITLLTVDSAPASA